MTRSRISVGNLFWIDIDFFPWNKRLANQDKRTHDTKSDASVYLVIRLWKKKYIPDLWEHAVSSAPTERNVRVKTVGKSRMRRQPPQHCPTKYHTRLLKEHYMWLRMGPARSCTDTKTRQACDNKPFGANYFSTSYGDNVFFRSFPSVCAVLVSRTLYKFKLDLVVLRTRYGPSINSHWANTWDIVQCAYFAVSLPSFLRQTKICSEFIRAPVKMENKIKISRAQHFW